MKRRKFIKNASLGTTLIALHPEFCLPGNKKRNDALNTDKGKTDLIEHIKLLTTAPLYEMKSFYVGKLGLSMRNETTNEITFVAGKSTITFVKIDSGHGDPWYHFAFNIPENKILKAREWQLRHTDLVPTPKRARDPKFPNDVRHFKNWNAHSVFFWDPAGNLLEYIARHDLDNGRPGEFTPQDILNVSEIAFVVDDQQDEAEKIGKNLGLDVYPKSSGFWWAMGDEMGLLLCIPKRIWGENTPHPKRFSVYNTEATIAGISNKDYEFDGFPYQVFMRNKI